MKAFLITGFFEDPRHDQPFSIEMAAETEDAVREKLLSTIGSRHKMERRQIHIDSIKELAAADVTDHVVKHQIGA